MTKCPKKRKDLKLSCEGTKGRKYLKIKGKYLKLDSKMPKRKKKKMKLGGKMPKKIKSGEE